MWKKDSLSTNDATTTGPPYAKKLNKSVSIKNRKIQMETEKMLGSGLGKVFLNRTQKP